MSEAMFDEVGEGESSLADDLSDTWCDEGCSWRVDYDAGAHIAPPWIVWLELVSDRRNPHAADFCTLSWQFDGVTVDAALVKALEWCEALIWCAS